MSSVKPTKKRYILAMLLGLALSALAQQGVEYIPNVFAVRSNPNKVLPLANGIVSAHTILNDTINYWNSSYDIALFYNDSLGQPIRQVSLMFTNGNQESFMDMIQTPDSGLLVLGIAEGVIPGGIYSGALYKVDKNGQVQWKKAYGGENGFVPSTLSYDQYTQTYLVSGLMERKGISRFYGRPYVFRVDSVGNLINYKDIILNNDTISDSKALFTIALADSTLLTAVIMDPWNQSEVYFIKFTNNLDTLWSKNPFKVNYVKSGMVKGYDFNKDNLKLTTVVGLNPIPQDRASTYIVEFDTAGNYELKNDLTEIIESYPGGGISRTLDTGYVIGAPFLKLNAQFEIEWQKSFSENLQINDIIQLANGSYALVGWKFFIAPNGTDGFERPYIQLTNSRGWMVGTAEQAKPKIQTVSIYPNPANHTVSIVGGQGAKVSISSITGQQVWSSTLTNNTFSIGHLPNGLYMVTVQLPNGSISTHRLAVQH